MDKSKTVSRVLFSVPVVESFDLPTRAELMPKIESGEMEHLDIRARVFGTGRVRNPVMFREPDMPAFAASFEGKPFLRDHDQYEIDARDGTILSSMLDGGQIVQDIRITTRRGMMDYLEGRIDRFSIGWDADQMVCSICEQDYLGGQCMHIAGRQYDTLSGPQTCLLIFINPVGVETSAVNVPAVDGTYIESQLQKLSLLNPDGGQAPAADKTDLPDVPAQARNAHREVADRLSHSITGGTTVNIREKIQRREDQVLRAKAIADLCDEEKRAMTAEETAEFDACLAQADTLAQEIKAESEQRERLRTAMELQVNAPASQEAQKPEPSTAAANPKVMKRGDFDALSLQDRSAFIRNGGKLED